MQAPDEKGADRDVRIAVKRADAAKLKAAVTAPQAEQGRAAQAHRYTTAKTTVTLIVKGARTSNGPRAGPGSRACARSSTGAR